MPIYEADSGSRFKCVNCKRNEHQLQKQGSVCDGEPVQSVRYENNVAVLSDLRSRMTGGIGTAQHAFEAQYDHNWVQASDQAVCKDCKYVVDMGDQDDPTVPPCPGVPKDWNAAPSAPSERKFFARLGLLLAVIGFWGVVAFAYYLKANS